MEQSATSTSSPHLARRRALAGLLAAVSLGLGHLYAGRRRAAWLLLVVGYPLMLGGAIVVGALDSGFTTGVILLLAATVVLWVGQLVWAVLAVEPRRSSGGIPGTPAWMYVVFIATTLILGNLPFAKLGTEAFKISSGSAMPALLPGDHLFVTKLGERNEKPRRGDLVVHEAPIPSHEAYVKRVVAVAGDEIEIRGGELILNGAPVRSRAIGSAVFQDLNTETGRWYTFEAEQIEETLGGRAYVVLRDANPDFAVPDFGPLVVPAGQYFVLGDNRDHSFDSRAYGPIALDSTIGRARLVWFSWGPDGLRGERVGVEL